MKGARWIKVPNPIKDDIELINQIKNRVVIKGFKSLIYEINFFPGDGDNLIKRMVTIVIRFIYYKKPRFVKQNVSRNTTLHVTT